MKLLISFTTIRLMMEQYNDLKHKCDENEISELLNMSTGLLNKSAHNPEIITGRLKPKLGKILTLH